MRNLRPSEQRNWRRDRVTFSIHLHSRNGENHCCKALNLSVAGMLLEYDGAGLAIGARVDILARLDTWQSEIPAVVIHSNSSCTGILFQAPQPDLYRRVTGSRQRRCLSINGCTPLPDEKKSPGPAPL